MIPFWPDLGATAQELKGSAVRHRSMVLEDGGARFHRWQRAREDALVGPEGQVVVVLAGPAHRSWTTDGVLLRATSAPWSVQEDEQGPFLETERGAEIDLLEVGPDAAESLWTDRSPPFTVMGSFARLAAPRELATFLSGGSVLDTNVFAGRRCPSEQTALSIYRLARHRGGPFWDGVADWIAGWVSRRLEGGRLPVHDLWDERETHARFYLDGVLVLLAHAEWRGSEPWRARAHAALALIDELRVPLGEGSWVRHDTVESRAGRNDWVLNTHVQATVVLMAAGRDVTPELRALEHVLGARPSSRAKAWKVSTALLVSDVSRAWLTSPAAAPGALSLRAREGIARLQQHSPFLRLPTGWIERDTSPTPSPGHYHTVNLADLAGLAASLSGEPPSTTLRAGVRYSRVAHARAERRSSEATAVLWPIVLSHLGRESLARRAARRAQAAGVLPAVGWPDHRDHLWSELAAGTP